MWLYIQSLKPICLQVRPVWQMNCPAFARVCECSCGSGLFVCLWRLVDMGIEIWVFYYVVYYLKPKAVIWKLIITHIANGGALCCPLVLLICTAFIYVSLPPPLHSLHSNLQSELSVVVMSYSIEIKLSTDATDPFTPLAYVCVSIQVSPGLLQKKLTLRLCRHDM